MAIQVRRCQDAGNRAMGRRQVTTVGGMVSRIQRAIAVIFAS